MTTQAILLFHTKSGVTAIPDLMGVDFILAQSWPKLSMKATALFCCSLQIKQVKNKERQLHRLFMDRLGECFALFAGTFSRFLGPHFVDINAKIDGKKSSFSVPGVVNVEVESLKIQLLEKNRTQKFNYQKD